MKFLVVQQNFRYKEKFFNARVLHAFTNANILKRSRILRFLPIIVNLSDVSNSLRRS